MGIYENPGLVGMVYVYSKGLEVLTLPLSDLASHSYLLFFTLWLAVMGLMMVYRISRLFMGREYSVLAAALCASLPAIMNMGISAKPDIITWLLQLIMIEYFFRYLISTGAGEDRNGKGSGRGNVTLLISVGGSISFVSHDETHLPDIFNSRIRHDGHLPDRLEASVFSRIPQALGVHNPAGGGPRRNLGENHDDNRNACDLRFHLHFCEIRI